VESFDISLETQLVKVTSATLSKEQIFEIIKKSGKATEIVE
jgi:copper chaperone CopZ